MKVEVEYTQKVEYKEVYEVNRQDYYNMRERFAEDFFNDEMLLSIFDGELEQYLEKRMISILKELGFKPSYSKNDIVHEDTQVKNSKVIGDE